MTKRWGLRSLLFVVGGFLLWSDGSRAAGPFSFYALNPCRILDTRNTGIPVTSGIQSNYKVVGLCGVPSSAKSVFLNVTVVSPTCSTFLNVYAYPGPFPGTSTVNSHTGERAIANGAIVALGTDPAYQVSVMYGGGPCGTTELVLDVMGYFQ